MTVTEADEVVEAEVVVDPVHDKECPAVADDLAHEEQIGRSVERAEVVSGGGASAAIEAAARAAVENPGIPGRDEFLSIAAQARMLSLSGAAPQAVRDSPHIAFHVAMIGRDLGLSPSSALELIDVIAGKNGQYQLSLSPQLLNGQIRRLRLGSIVPAYRGTDRAVAWAMGPRGADPRCLRLCEEAGTPSHVDGCDCDLLGSSEFTWEDARDAGLVGEECNPGRGQHKMQTRTGRCGCNQGYITYPKRMLWWRASGFAADDYFPEASLGLYSAEALGAVVDHNGRAIDVASVELPDGYEAPALSAAQQGAAAAVAADTAPGDPEVLADLGARVAALPAPIKAQLSEKWKQSERLRGHKLSELPAGAVQLAKSMIAGFERIAAREAPATGDAPAAPAAPAASDDAPGTEDAPESTTGHTTAVGNSDDEVVDAEVVDEQPAKVEKPKPDAETLAAVRAIVAEAEHLGVDVEAVAAAVKALHHAHVDRELAEVGGPTDGHIDTRRMLLSAARLDAAMHPGQCRHLGCAADKLEGSDWCFEHGSPQLDETST